MIGDWTRASRIALLTLVSTLLLLAALDLDEHAVQLYMCKSCDCSALTASKTNSSLPLPPSVYTCSQVMQSVFAFGRASGRFRFVQIVRFMLFSHAIASFSGNKINVRVVSAAFEIAVAPNARIK